MKKKKKLKLKTKKKDYLFCMIYLDKHWQSPWFLCGVGKSNAIYTNVDK